jgi:hypothetical protein
MLIEKLFHSKLSQIVNSNVNYKKRTNNFGQVNLLNVKLGEGETIPATHTEIILNAASINDESINQSAFHIFKCWNNRAYEEDVPNKPNVVIPVIKTNNY